MRFCALGSGSRGNAMLIEARHTRLMLDNGFSLRETEKRLGLMGADAGSINAILVTHEHADHVNGVGAFARKYGLTVYATMGTYNSSRLGELPDIRLISSHQSFSIGDLQINPFPVPHDAREPCQFVFCDGNRRLGILTDTGSSTAHIEEQLTGCDALVLECNHDRTLLAQGGYPYHVKLRVAGDYGHLNNEQAASLLRRIDTSSLQHIVAAHISEKHNTPALAQQSLSAALCCQREWIAVAGQQSGLNWRDVN
ncbi:MAG: MBL fold metallo-hydrolase [Gammaproteobacteria bacterium]|nr:MBL fold metallo-hydrolase [Gammaproteobacteria bacterium]